MISFKIGDIVPADCGLMEAINIHINQAVLTEECQDAWRSIFLVRSL
jgi:magnesium-transporting ATPase (P-type)